MRMRTRFILALAVAITLPTAVVAHLVGRELLVGWRQQTTAAELREAEAVTFAIETYLRRAVEIVASNAERASLRRALASGTSSLLAEAMAGLSAQALGFEVLFVVDAHGTMRFNDVDPSLVGQDVSSRDDYRGVLRTGRPYVSAPFIGRAAREPVVAVAAPIRDERGELLGLLGGDVPLRALAGLLQEAPDETGIFVILGPGAIVLAHSQPGHVMQPAGMAEPAIARALQGETGAVEWTDAHGVRQLSVFTPIAPLGWAVVHTQPLAAVYAPLWGAGRHVLLVALVALGLAALAGIFLAEGLARPILGLRAAVRRLGQGDWQARLHLRRRDELGELAAEFDTMADRLEVREADLERRMRELALLQTIDQGILAGMPLSDLLQAVVHDFAELTGARHCFLVVPDGGEQILRLVATSGPHAEDLAGSLADHASRVPEGAAGQAIATRAPVASPDVATDPLWGRLREGILARGDRAVVAVPLVAGDEVLGAVGLGYPDPRPFPEAELQTLQRFGNQLGIALQQARLREAAAERFRAEAANRAKSLFLANMSHELRTPLTSILGFGEMLELGTAGPLTDKQRRYVGNIHEASRHLLALINDILDLSKAEAGQFTLSPERVAVASALEAALLLTKGLAAKKHVHLTLQVEDGLEILWADPVRLKQMLYNLVSNAVKFTPEGGAVILLARPVDSAVEIAVRDTGIGIRAEDIPKLFTEFSQLGPQRAEGTGLGLALTKRLVELHGGTIRVESVPGRGSTFTLTLPTHPPSAVPGAAEAAMTSGPPFPQGPHTAHVLEARHTDQLVGLGAESGRNDQAP